MKNLYDIFIIGGGINGSVISRDAAGRGFKVCLEEELSVSIYWKLFI